MRRSLCICVGLSALTLGFYVTGWAQPAAAPTDIGKLVADDVEQIKKALAKKNVAKDMKTQGKMRLAALMIAQYAQAAMSKDNPKNASLATLRDQALAFHKAVDDGKLDQARKLAATLSLKITANPAAKLQPVDLAKIEGFDNVMGQFSSARAGGFGMEEFLENLVELKGKVDDEEAVKIQTYAHKVGMIARLSLAHTPIVDGKKKTLKAWMESSKDMKRTSAELAVAAKSRNDETIRKAAVKLDASCKSCHKNFR